MYIGSSNFTVLLQKRKKPCKKRLIQLMYKMIMKFNYRVIYQVVSNLKHRQNKKNAFEILDYFPKIAAD